MKGTFDVKCISRKRKKKKEKESKDQLLKMQESFCSIYVN